MALSSEFRIGFAARWGARRGRAPAALVAAFCALAAGLLVPFAPARADHPVAVGDVVEIYVARVPELQRRVTVRPDGTISYPLLGTLPIAGLSPAAMEQKIQAGLTAKVFQRRSLEGRQADVAISPEEVTASVVEQRPVYVNGDVARPGEYAYRSGMSVLQAIALAGGYSPIRSRVLDPIIELIELRRDSEAARAELAREQARIWRIGMELGDALAGRNEQGEEVRVDPAFKKLILRIEEDRMLATRADHGRERALLDRSVKQNEEQVRILSDLQKEEEGGYKADVDELRKMQQLYSTGTLVNLRLTEARRAVMLSATRRLQTTAQLLQVRRQRDEFASRLEGIGEKHRIELLRELEDATVKAATLGARLRGASDKAQYLLQRAQTGAETGPQIELAIVRKSATGSERIGASEGTALHPGDVLEVIMRSERNATSAPLGPARAAPTR